MAGGVRGRDDERETRGAEHGGRHAPGRHTPHRVRPHAGLRRKFEDQRDVEPPRGDCRAQPVAGSRAASVLRRLGPAPAGTRPT